jgi:methionyl-tRNA formyltransferase
MKLKIIFMGTPEFAIPSLKILLNHGYRIMAVITAVDKPSGRGRIITASPVKRFALEHNIPVLQPKNLKNPDFLETLKSYKANLQVVVAFRMLPELVWSMPDLGTFNLHASLLPYYRGAAPINWVLMNGEKKTGLTTFFIKQEIDTGNIILQEEEPIHPEDDAGTLHDRLMMKGADLVLRTVKAIETGSYTLTKQEEVPGMMVAPKITREMCRIDWNQKQAEIYDFVRGLSPYPSAWTEVGDTVYKIFKVLPGERKIPNGIGEFHTDNRTFIDFQCSDGLIRIMEWQPEGKRKMSPAEFFRGNKI